MREFFHGWRRKAGVLALMMALGFVGAWVRSLYVQDVFRIRFGPLTHILNSTRGTFRWHRYADPAGGKFGFVNTPTEWIVDDLKASRIVDPWNPTTLRWQWQSCGLKFGTGKIGSASGETATATGTVPNGFRILEFGTCAIPYWMLVIPLTLLSAYLILWKPRKPQSFDKPAISNLIPN